MVSDDHSKLSDNNRCEFVLSAGMIVLLLLQFIFQCVICSVLYITNKGCQTSTTPFSYSNFFLIRWRNQVQGCSAVGMYCVNSTTRGQQSQWNNTFWLSLEIQSSEGYVTQFCHLCWKCLIYDVCLGDWSQISSSTKRKPPLVHWFKLFWLVTVVSSNLNIQHIFINYSKSI